MIKFKFNLLMINVLKIKFQNLYIQRVSVPSIPNFVKVKTLLGFIPN